MPWTSGIQKSASPTVTLGNKKQDCKGVKRLGIVHLRNATAFVSACYSVGSSQPVSICARVQIADCWFIQLGRTLFFILWVTAKLRALGPGTWLSHLLGPWKLTFSVPQADVTTLASRLEQAVWLSDSCNQSVEPETKRPQIRKSQWWWPAGANVLIWVQRRCCLGIISLNIIH